MLSDSLSKSIPLCDSDSRLEDAQAVHTRIVAIYIADRLRDLRDPTTSILLSVTANQKDHCKDSDRFWSNLARTRTYALGLNLGIYQQKSTLLPSERPEQFVEA